MDSVFRRNNRDQAKIQGNQRIQQFLARLLDGNHLESMLPNSTFELSHSFFFHCSFCTLAGLCISHWRFLSSSANGCAWGNAPRTRDMGRVALRQNPKFFRLSLPTRHYRKQLLRKSSFPIICIYPHCGCSR